MGAGHISNKDINGGQRQWSCWLKMREHTEWEKTRNKIWGRNTTLGASALKGVGAREEWRITREAGITEQSKDWV